jgi:hypothetical protein
MHYVEAIKQKSARDVLEVLRKAFQIFGFPSILQTDNGSEFENELMRIYLGKHNIELRHGKPYHPQAQGKVERGNRSLKSVITNLRKEIKSRSGIPVTWYDVLYEASLCLNTTLSTAIRKTPYEHVFLMKPVNEGNISGYSKAVKAAIEEVDKELEEVFLEELKETEAQKEQTQLDNIMGDDKCSEEDEKTDAGYESPGITEVNPEYYFQERAKRIRDDSKRNYDNHVKRMKIQHDRLRNVLDFELGSVVGVIIPKDYMKKQETNKLPAMVIKVDLVKDEKLYTLAYGNKQLENKYFQHELVAITGLDSYLQIITQEPLEVYLERMTNAAIGKTLEKITLQTAYNEYLEKICAVETHEDIKELLVAEAVDCNEQANMVLTEESDTHLGGLANTNVVTLPAIIKDKETQTLKRIRVKLVSKLCYVCKEQMDPNQRAILCSRCGCKMHHPDDCEFGMVPYTYAGKLYCSLSCHLNQVNPEVKIIKENMKTGEYTILYKNGNTSRHTKKKIESLSQYKKMLHDWRVQHPIGEQSIDDDVIIIDKLSDVSNSSSSIARSNNESDVCCVCNEQLTADNPHNCYMCKRRMHGRIICPQRESMFAVDDKLYCTDCKQKL